jgi:hypothetical protein
METASAFLFPGYLPLVLAVAAVASIFRRSLPDREGLVSGWRGRLRTSPAAFYALLTVLTACLAAGPPIGLWPLVYWLPGFNFVRVPSRFVILGVLGLAVLAGIGFDRLTSRFRADARRNWAIALGMLLLVECAVVPLPVVPYRVEIPAADRWLAGRPRPFVVAEAPVTTSDRLQSIYMLHSTAHWQKTVHGHSGLRAPEHEELYHEMRYFPDEESLDHLQRLRVDYVVVHTAFYRPGEWPEVERRLAAFQSRLTLEYDDGAARVYAIRPR